MTKPKLYLAGKMSGLSIEEMSGWRLVATKLLDDDFHIINPCVYYNFEMDRSTYTESEIKEFDLHMVKRSDIILVNFDFPDSIGTAIELHMAHDVWNIPVVAYGGLSTEVHPWMTLSVTKRCKTLSDAVSYIYKYYLKNI